MPDRAYYIAHIANDPIRRRRKDYQNQISYRKAKIYQLRRRILKYQAQIDGLREREAATHLR
jgi:hypothetical protein